jgi:hypothetical protein
VQWATEVPIEIIEATYEAALREDAAPGLLSQDIVKADHVISEGVDSLSTAYSEGGFSTEDRRRHRHRRLPGPAARPDLRCHHVWAGALWVLTTERPRS